jgi:hypothetical protein
MRKDTSMISPRKRMAMGEKVQKMRDGGMTASRGGMKAEPEAMGAARRPGLASELARYNGADPNNPPKMPSRNEPVIDVIVRKVREATGMKSGGKVKGRKC